MAKAMNNFTDCWKSEQELLRLYPKKCTVSYGELSRSRTGKDICDWVVTDHTGTELARHTLLFLINKQGETYARVSVKPKPKPLSSELKALFNAIGKIHGAPQATEATEPPKAKQQGDSLLLRSQSSSLDGVLPLDDLGPETIAE